MIIICNYNNIHDGKGKLNILYLFKKIIILNVELCSGYCLLAVLCGNV